MHKGAINKFVLLLTIHQYILFQCTRMLLYYTVHKHIEPAS
jgi:hypothetical protein